jgi:hypothetical protein
VPWLKYVIPEKDFTNEYNAQYRVNRWLHLDGEKYSTIDLITRQIKCILNNEHTNKRTWMPSGLVQMVRQGEELITQYNIMKTVTAPSTYLTEDHVSVEITITVEKHPTVEWAAEAHNYHTLNEAQHLKELDERKQKRYPDEQRRYE